jgi:hypothetical protein
VREVTDDALNQLALDACETIGYKGGQIAAYDVAGYDRVERREVAPTKVEQRDVADQPSPPRPARAAFQDTPHLVRIGGFRRKQLCSPDEIGERIRESGIPWNDGLGNGMYESLLIDRKYGFNHVIEAPLFGYPLPWLESEWPAFREKYSARINYWATRLEELESVYGMPLLDRDPGLCVLNFRETPLSLFTQAYDRNPSAVQATLREELGREIPPVQPETPQERLVLSRFWALLRRRQAAILSHQREKLESILGDGTVFVGNFHELPPMDMERLGQTYDQPAVAVRPLLLDDPVMLRQYTAYFTQLFHDLTGKRPMVSVRINLSAAGARFVPEAGLIRKWHDQAACHGAGGFYLWPRDYPMDTGDPYDGPMLGNPVRNTLPSVRWESSVQLLGKLARRQRFLAPAARVGILVPRDGALLQREEWRRIYGAFSACAEARIHTRFLADWQIISEGMPNHLELLVAPVLEFVSDELRHALTEFVDAGGRLLVRDGSLTDETGAPASPIQGSETIADGTFDLFPLEAPADLDTLQETARRMREEVEARDIEDQSWIYDVTVSNLPPSSREDLRTGEPGIIFSHWMYEHGSDWIYPYLNGEQ